MGNEAKCRAVVDGKAAFGALLLETDEILFRGDGIRAVFRFAELLSVSEEGGSLILVSKAGQRAAFDLGARAATWAEKIRSPKGRLDKLGVMAESEVSVTGAPLEEAFLGELAARAKRVKKASPGKATNLVLLGVDAARGLARIAALRAKLPEGAALWVVYPKGRKDPSETDVIGAGRAAGLKDVKVARFSETHTALKFVAPKAR